MWDRQQVQSRNKYTTLYNCGTTDHLCKAGLKEKYNNAPSAGVTLQYKEMFSVKKKSDFNALNLNKTDRRFISEAAQGTITYRQ